MPKLDTPAGLLWAVTIILQPVLVFLLLRCSTWRRWPSLLAFFAWHSARSFVLLILFSRGAEAPYFYTYWLGSFVAYLIQVWILAQIASCVFGITARYRQNIGYGVGIFSLVTLCVSAYLSASVHFDLARHITEAVFYVDRAMTLAWALAFMFIAWSASLVGLRWRREVLGISAGFALNSICGLCFAWAATACGIDSISFLSTAKSCGYAVSLSVWIVVVLRGSPSIVLSQPVRELLAENLRGYSFSKSTAPKRPHALRLFARFVNCRRTHCLGSHGSPPPRGGR